MDNNQASPNPSTTNPRQQIVERLKQANNVLVTVSSNPSVDQLAACIGLTLMLNKLGKHGTAVFSGEVPSTIEFLKPEATLEKNTNSLRDFIIALDKSKADKLRYKVEDKVVKIFITPYKTSISDKDLEFSQGDFNVDVVVALGVHQQQDLDQAITSHGRILHDATVISVNNTAQGSNIGNLSWIDPSVSSLSELVSLLDGQLGKSVLDAQISTALLTGIVAETDRFSNNKTSSQTMTISAKLMSAGANQQLVATKLEESAPAPVEPRKKPSVATTVKKPAPTKPANYGTINIDHGDKLSAVEPEEPQIHIDDAGIIHNANEPLMPPQPPVSSGINITGGSPILTKPPTWDNKLTANSEPDSFEQGHEPVTDPLSLPSVEPPLLNRNNPTALSAIPLTPPANSLTESHIDSARSAVDAANAAITQPLTPRVDLNAQPVFDNLHPAALLPTQNIANPLPTGPPILSPAPGFSNNPSASMPADQAANTLNMPMPPATQGQFRDPNQPDYDEDVPSGLPSNGSAMPPPVPPPMVPPVF